MYTKKTGFGSNSGIATGSFSRSDFDRSNQEVLKLNQELSRNMVQNLNKVRSATFVVKKDVSSLDKHLGSILRSLGKNLAKDFKSILLKNITKILKSSLKSGGINFGSLMGGVTPFKQSFGSSSGGGLSSSILSSAGSLFGKILPFAKGGVVKGAQGFSFSSSSSSSRGKLGVMGESGSEAIMPLSRSNDGSLGVQVNGLDSRPINITINALDSDSIQQSKHMIGRMIRRSLVR